MKTMELAGRSTLVKTGSIDSYGNHQVESNRTKYSIIEFSDGERLREVWADSALDRYITGQAKGHFVFLKISSKEHCLVAFESASTGLRVADRELWKDISKLVSRIAIYFLFGGLLLSLLLVGIPIFILSLYLFSVAAKIKNIGVYADKLRDMGTLGLDRPSTEHVVRSIAA